jgi:hypothetical protein
VDGKDEDFSHRANRTTTASACKAARRVRIASHWEFATRRSTPPSNRRDRVFAEHNG